MKLLKVKALLSNYRIISDTILLSLKNQTLLREITLFLIQIKFYDLQYFGTEITCLLNHSKKSVSGIQNVYQVNFHLLPWFYYSISNSPHPVVLALLPQHELRYMVHPLDGLASHPQLKSNRRISWSIQTNLTASLLSHLKLQCYLIPTLGANWVLLFLTFYKHDLIRYQYDIRQSK
jgi:hypothetical protein